MHATADLSVLAATARLGGAFGGGRGTWSVAARRTYADAVTSMFTDDVFPYHFRDIHGHAAYELSRTVRVAVTAYCGKDVLDADFAESRGTPRLEGERGPVGVRLGQWRRRRHDREGARRRARIPLLGWQLGERTTIEQRVSSSGFSTRSTSARARSPSAAASATSGSAGRFARAARRTNGRSATSWRRIASATRRGRRRRGPPTFDLAQRP